LLVLKNAPRFARRSNNSNNDKKSSFNTRGFLRHSKFHKRELLTLPKLSDASKFFPYVIPVTTTLLGRVSAYVTMSHVISATMGPVNMAGERAKRSERAL